MINIGLIAQWVYIIGYVYKLVVGASFLATIPDAPTIFYTSSSIFIHLSTTFALIFTYNFKPTIKTLFLSVMFLFGMYAVALFFTTPDQGINFVLSYKTLIPLAIPHYTELWVLLTFLVVVLPTQLLQYLIYEHSDRKSQVHNRD